MKGEGKMSGYAFDQVAGRLAGYREALLSLPEHTKSQAYDIRFKSGQPVSVWGREGMFILSGMGEMSAGELEELFLRICGYSVFSHEEELRQGFVSVGGACRAGVCGTAVLEDGRVKGVRDITSLVFRIPREVPGCGDRLFREGVRPEEGLLIAGEPASGKTTLLRDIARSLSMGRFGPCRRVAVLDARGELGGFDLGPCADLLVGFPKKQALHMALRTLSPEVLVCDELAPEDLEAVESAVYAGVGIVATVHAGAGQAAERPLCRELLATGAFGTVVGLRGRQRPCEIISIKKMAGAAL